LLAVISDHDSWINGYIPDMLVDWLHQGHAVLWAHHPLELAPGDFCFLLGCGQLVPLEKLAMFKHNLVVHESDLPKGKGCIRDQFNLFRVVDNGKYPGWFDMYGQIYYLKIRKKKKSVIDLKSR